MVINIVFDWRPFVKSEMPDEWLKMVVLVAPGLENDSNLIMNIECWTGTETAGIEEKLIEYWAPYDEIEIQVKKENAASVEDKLIQYWLPYSEVENQLKYRGICDS